MVATGQDPKPAARAIVEAADALTIDPAAEPTVVDPPHESSP